MRSIWVLLCMAALVAACRPAIVATPAPKARDLGAPTTPPCPQPTPEPFRVEPVFSPTNEPQQMITVRIGNGEAVTIEANGVAHVVTGDFSAFSAPANITVPLLPNTLNILKVTGRVRQMDGPNGCKYGGYELRTERDRNGNPLVIDQRAASRDREVPVAGGSQPGTPQPTPCPVATPAPWVLNRLPEVTNQLQHTVTLMAPPADVITATVNDRVFTGKGTEVAITLQANITNTIAVTVQLRPFGAGSDCTQVVATSERDSINKPMVVVHRAQPAANNKDGAVARTCLVLSYDALIAKTAVPAPLASLESGACVTILYKGGDTASARWAPKGSTLKPARTLYVRRGNDLVTLFTKDGRLMAREFLPGQKAEDRALVRDGEIWLLAASGTPVLRVDGNAWTALVDVLARDN